MHTRTRSEYKSFVHSVYPKPYYSPPRMSKCVIIIVWCQNRHSGDVICIQGQDLSTNHLFILFIQNPISVSAIAKMCYDYCLMPTPTVEMSYAYKDEIWVQIICDSFHPKPNFCQPCFLNCVMITVWCHHRHSGDVICIQGRDLSTNHLWLCLSKTLLQSAPYVKMCHYYCLMPKPT